MADAITALIPLKEQIERVVRSAQIGAIDQLAATLAVQVAVWVGKNVLPSTPGLMSFTADLDVERARQLAKFGDQRHSDGTGSVEQQKYAETARRWCQDAFGSGYGTWADILDEEVAEAKAERDPAKLRAELVQIAAVCAAWVSDIDRRQTDVTDGRTAGGAAS